MKKLAALTLSMFLVSGTALADTPKDADAQPAKAAQPAKPKAAKKADKSDSAIAAEIEELRQALQSQQEQLQLLKEELAKRDRQIDEAREAAAAANARAAEASTKATEAANTTAEVKTTAAALNTTVSDLKASNEVLKTTVAAEQADAQKAMEEGPSTIKYKGINITPGGFLVAETVFRTRNDTSDINSDFTGIPYPGQASSKITESQFSGRQSRLSLLAQTKVGTANISAYYEGDFLNAGVTSNNRQSNSYPFRQRQAWVSAKFDNGFYVSGGQMWSLVTESKKGIENRQEAFPLQIDAQYVVGWAWQRAYGFRVAKNFDKFAVGFSVEGPQTTIGGRNFNPNFFFNNTCDAAGLLNAFDSNGCTINKSPDFLVKATLDPGWGHYEVVGILSPFRNRVYPCFALSATQPITGCTGTTDVTGAFNDTRVGGGIGVTGRFPVIAKKLDLVAHFQGGDGIGRYSSAQLKDVTARPDGTLAPIRSAAWLGMLEAHPYPKLDLYAYGGGEYAARTAYIFTNAAGHPVGVGYGSQLANNSGCSTETAPTSATGPSGSAFPTNGGTCNGDIRTILEGTLGFWYKFYQGPKGRVQFGVQYSYFTKIGWSGNNGSGNAAPGASVNPKAVENMVFTSFRYYLP
jgi:hypothetical protein